MQAAPKPRGRGFPSDHESRPLSISGHHVTEAIGDMYGDGDSDHERQASLGGDEGFDFKKLNSKGHSNGVDGSSQRTGGRPTSRLVPSKSWDANLPTKGSSGSRSDEPPRSPTLSIRSQTSLSDAASSHFPLDYDSSPAAVAQELSNLQALRRMSMDVSSLADPDLPSFNFVPPTAPKGSDSEDDPSRLFWVPARLHPELAPKEFKLFVETRVKEIRRPSTSSDGGSLSPNSAGGSHTLRRKKSMLSRQIEADGKTAETYEDGAERLERRKSQRGDRPPTVKVSDLEKLDELVKDPSSLMRKLSLTSAANGEVKPMSMDDDRPILPAAPPGHALKRSTRTQYRRGGSQKGMRGGLARRMGRASESEDEPPLPAFGGIKRVQTEPLPSASRQVKQDHLSTPSKPQAATHSVSPSASFDDLLSNAASAKPQREPREKSEKSEKKEKRSKSPARATISQRSTSLKERPPPVPQLALQTPQSFKPPERQSSFEPPPQQPQPNATAKRPPLRRASAKESSATLSAVEHAAPSITPLPSKQATNNLPMPGPQSASRTDSLSIIPTFDTKDEKKDDKKEKKSASSATSKKSSWGWLRGDHEKDKDKEKEKEPAKVRKSKSTKDKDKDKDKDKPHDTARLDLIQKSIDGAKAPDARELERLSADQDREREQAERERKERDMKKSPAESKKEKDAGLFSSLFGGSKKKSSTDLPAKAKTSASRGISPDPPSQTHRPSTPQYYYTRFPIHIERAIYRLSHIKLANPKRPLQQQVLLSNFMYSYLAKVQATAPQQQQQVQAAPVVVVEPQPAMEEPEQQQQQQQQMYAEHDQDQQQYYQYDNGTQVMQQEYAEDGQMYDYDDQDDDYYSDDDQQQIGYASSEGTSHHRHHNHHHHKDPHAPQLQYHHQTAGTVDDRGRSDDMW